MMYPCPSATLICLPERAGARLYIQAVVVSVRGRRCEKFCLVSMADVLNLHTVSPSIYQQERRENKPTCCVYTSLCKSLFPPLKVLIITLLLPKLIYPRSGLSTQASGFITDPMSWMILSFEFLACIVTVKAVIVNTGAAQRQLKTSLVD